MGPSRLLLGVILPFVLLGKVHCWRVRVAGGSGKDVVKEVVDMIKNSGIFPDDKKFLCRVAWVESKYGTDRNTYRRGYHGGIWQVDKIGYKDTVSHWGARRYHAAIKREFGIDWPKTQWADLRKPLYSGLAARLFLVRIPESIPYSLAGQAAYWKKHYNKTGKGTKQKFIDDVEKATGCAK